MRVKKEQREGSAGWHSAHLGVALEGAHLVSNHGAGLLAITESLFQTNLDRVSGILVSTI